MISSRFPDIVLDCPDPATLGRFYAEVVDGKLSLSDDWAELESGQGRSICFQQVADYNPPQWPGQEVPQQFHLDFYVKDLDAAVGAVLHPTGETEPLGLALRGGTKKDALDATADEQLNLFEPHGTSLT